MLNANEQKILDLIRTNKADTQAHLCNLTGINSSTMTYILGRLKKKGLVADAGKRISGPGKPAIVLKYAPAGLILAIDIDCSRIMVGVINSSSNTTSKGVMEMEIELAPEAILQKIVTFAGKLLKKAATDWDHVSLIGLSVNGTVSNGILEFSTVLPWRNLPIAAMISKMTGVEVVCSDGRYRAVAESRQVIYKDYSSILYFNAADGVSVRYVANGELFLGQNFRSGEIGHVVFEPSGYLCGCGQKGCLQTLISGPGICRQIANDVQKLKTQPGLTSLLSSARNLDAENTIDKLVELAYETKCRYATELLQRIASYAARALASSIALFDPHLVLIDGYVFRNRDRIITSLRQNVRDLYFPLNKDCLPEFRSTVLGDEARLQCVAMLCSDRLQKQL